eukprot:9895804-Lingulodinium_polyedra.AAC.1
MVKAKAKVARQYRVRTFQPCMASDLRAREAAVTARSLASPLGAGTQSVHAPPVLATASGRASKSGGTP